MIPDRLRREPSHRSQCLEGGPGRVDERIDHAPVQEREDRVDPRGSSGIVGGDGSQRRPAEETDEAARRFGAWPRVVRRDHEHPGGPSPDEDHAVRGGDVFEGRSPARGRKGVDSSVPPKRRGRNRYVEPLDHAPGVQLLEPGLDRGAR